MDYNNLLSQTTCWKYIVPFLDQKNILSLRETCNYFKGLLDSIGEGIVIKVRRIDTKIPACWKNYKFHLNLSYNYNTDDGILGGVSMLGNVHTLNLCDTKVTDVICLEMFIP